MAKLSVTQHKTASGIEYEIGSGNVFEDLGLPDSEELLLKAQLAMQIRHLIRGRKLTEAQVAHATGLDQPRVSKLVNGRISDFSVARLLMVLRRLGHRVEVRIAPSR